MKYSTIIYKLFFIIFSFVFICIYFRKSTINYDYNNAKVNSIYTDVTKDINDFRIETIEEFFGYIKKYQYQNAYDMLEDNCKKEIFNNNINEFQKIIESKYLDEKIVNKQILYRYFTENDKGNFLFKVNFSINDDKILNRNISKSDEFYLNSSIIVTFYGKTPFKSKLYLNI